MYDRTSAPEIIKQICKELHLPSNVCQLLSHDRSVCIVNDDWIKSLHLGEVVPLSGMDNLDASQIERFLSRSCDKIPQPWVKITVKAVAKSDRLYHVLPGQYLHKQWSCGSLYEFMSHITKENMTNLWARAHSVLKGGTSQHLSFAKSEDSILFTNVVKELLHRLKPLIYISLLPDSKILTEHSQTVTDIRNASTSNTVDSSNFITGSSKTGSFYTTSDTQTCHGIVPIEAVIESESHFYLIQSYYQYTLRDTVTFSPTILDTSHAKPLFIVYQILHAMHALHSRGLRMGEIQMSDIVMDKNMWLRLTSPKFNILKVHEPSTPTAESDSVNTASNSSDAPHSKITLPLIQDIPQAVFQQYSGAPNSGERAFEAACEFMKSQRFRFYEITMLDSIVDAWVNRRIPNFQYLMILNHLAGRQMGDPNNHPVLPWVLDFSFPDSGYRDLTKSKFRLNKGDGQLDFMYSEMYEVSDSGNHVPHHVSDILSDITYYVYKARRTAKHILCAHVRANWVPHEYPVSMQRLQDWTPDECIPEFFTDPSIFDSIHEDLPDLEIPPWSKNTVDFIIHHLSALESDYVSSNLHHWIDLTFGYKLSGIAAIKAKNVHLHLVDQHTYLTSHGATQLFQQPHPQRKPQYTAASALLPRITRGLLNSQLLTYGLPDSDNNSQFTDASFDSTELGRINQAAIHLPRNYNPLTELEQCEALLEFKSKALHASGSTTPVVKTTQPPKYQDEGITEDMVTLTCLVSEMFLGAKLRMQDSHVSLWKRVMTIRKLCMPDFNEIQRPFQKFVSDMFQALEITATKKIYFKAVFPDGSPPPTPGFLIQPYSDLIPFPQYFGELYSCLSKIEEKTQEIELLKRRQQPVLERANKIKQLEREKVPILGAFLWKYQSYLGSEGMGIILPYIQDLLQNEYTTAQAAWSLFDSTTRELGPASSAKQFLPFLIALFSGEMSSAKHIKLYHRSFLVQLIIRLGLKTFLTYFSTLLVEAVAGYKDFNVSSRFYPEELLEELSRDDIHKTSPHKPKPMSWSEDEYPVLGDYKVSVGEADESEDVDDADGGVADNGKNESVSECDLADVMSLDGAHVLLEDDSSGSGRKISHGDASEGDSVGSESGDDRHDEIVAKRRVGCDGASAGPYDNQDQHSIHSISNIMMKHIEDSPTVLDDLETFGTFQDSETDLSAENSPLLVAKGSFSHEFQTQLERGDRSRKISFPGSHTNGHELNEEEGTRRRTSENENTREGLKEAGDENFSKHSKGLDIMSSQETLTSSCISSPMHTASYKPEDDASSKHLVNSTDSSDNNTQRSSNSSNIDEVDAKRSLQASSGSDSQQRPRTMSDMVRSETEDLMLNLSSDSSGRMTNIRDIAADSVKWLSHKLGPVLATKFLSRNLVRMLALCYLGQEQLQFIEHTSENIAKTSRLVAGDRNAQKVLECIGFTVVLYGEQVILIQCLPNIMDMIILAQKRLSLRTEGGLIASVVLLSFLIPYLSDTNLMNLLEDSIISGCINPVLSVITSPNISFPGGALARFVLCHKLIDLLYILGLRLGLEMTRNYLTSSMQQLFDTFSSVHGGANAAPESIHVESSQDHSSYSSDESYLTIKMDLLTHQYKIGSPIDLRSLKSPPKQIFTKMHSLSAVGIIDDKDDYVDAKSPSSTAERCAQEMKSVFTPELAQACFIPLCRIFGSIHMEEKLHNEDLIRLLCSQHDTETDLSAPKGQESQNSKAQKLVNPVDDLLTPTEERSVSGGMGSNVAMIGNRIQLNETESMATHPEIGQFGRGYKHSGILAIHQDDLRSSDMEQNKSRHLRGNWLAYCERELGLHERDTMFNFMQIELQTYLGHTSSIRSLYTMDTENCFISACKDRAVRLWSISSSGDGMKKQYCQFCYSRHKKSVFSVIYVESMRLVASCDSTVHIWDPYTGVAVSQLESSKYAPVVALTALPAPSTLVAMATTESSLRFLDMRTSKYAHEFRCSVGSTGLIRCVVVSPESNWVAIGFSTGFIYILDVNSGMFLHYWKAHDGEILQLKAYSKSRLLSSAFDQTIKLWNVETGQEVCATKSQSEPVHCLSIYRDQLLTATTANRISVYASLTDGTAFASSKLKSASFKGVLTCMSVLPLNKALLLGADNGTIRLMA